MTPPPKGTRKRNCEICGSAMPRAVGMGRPQKYCHVDTGRKCKRLAKVLREAETLSEQVFGHVEVHVRGRTRWRLRHIYQGLADQWTRSERDD